jgi:hypothetical protein
MVKDKAYMLKIWSVNSWDAAQLLLAKEEPLLRG